MSEIKIIKTKISLPELRELAEKSYGDMVKAVVDIKKRIIAVGGEFHADAEAFLLENGSKQDDLWGINIYPGYLKEEMIEFSSLINIRPKIGNRSMAIEIKEVKEKIIATVSNLVE